MNESNEEMTSHDIACAISAKRNKLTHFDVSRMEHYNRCHARGRVPVSHYSGGWYNSYANAQLILLYLRLPKHIQSLVTTPKGLTAYTKMSRKAKAQLKEYH